MQERQSDTADSQGSNNQEQPNQNFSYQVSTLPGKVRKPSLLEKVRSPRNASGTKMYIMFFLGSTALFLLSYITIKDVSFVGRDTYIEYFNRYSQLGQIAINSLIIMILVNVFWIIINTLIEFLANYQEWIPKIETQKVERQATEIPNRINTITPQAVIAARYNFNEAYEIAKEEQLVTAEKKEDQVEYQAILDNAALSPLAFLWIGVKNIYRFFGRAPRRFSFFWIKGSIAWEYNLSQFRDFIKNTWEVLIYFLNPFNLIEEVIDVSITVLVRFLYPAILTPIIFFFPMKIMFVFEQVWEIAIYFLLIGGLRVGVEFFSIYIRFLRNTRAIE